MMREKLSKKSEQGIAMMLCLFALLLLTSIAMGLMFMSNTEVDVSTNYRTSTQAFYAAKAGIEEARERLRYGSADFFQAPTGLPSTSNPNGIIYILNTADASNDPVAPWDGSNPYFDDELCGEPLYDSSSNLLLPTTYFAPCAVGPPAGSFTPVQSNDPGYSTKRALGYKWVRVTPKQNCTAYYGVDGTVGNFCQGSANHATIVCAYLDTSGAVLEKLATGSSCDNSSPVYVITALASAKRGPRRMAQAEVSAMGAGLGQVPAALTLIGTPDISNPSTPDVGLANSNTSLINGNDHAGATTGCTAGTPKPAIATTNTTAYNNVYTVLSRPSSFPANYAGVGYALPSTPSLQNVTLGAAFSSTMALQRLITNITNVADQKFSTSADLPLGTDAIPLITVINGDYTINTPTHGAGLLLVTGKLMTMGNLDFNGLVLVIGKGDVRLNAMTMTNDGALNGGIVVAKIYDSSNNLLLAPANPQFWWIAGGNYSINYDSCWINRMASRFGYQVIAEREKAY